MDKEFMLKDLERKLKLSLRFRKKWKLLTDIFNDTLKFGGPNETREKKFNELKELLCEIYPQTGMKGYISAVIFEPAIGVKRKINDTFTELMTLGDLSSLFRLVRSSERGIILKYWEAMTSGSSQYIGGLQNEIYKLKHGIDLTEGGDGKLDTFSELCLQVKEKLRAIIYEKPENEKEVQKSVNSLLVALGYDFEWDKDAFSFSSKSTKPDFTSDEFSIAIEVKYVKEAERLSKVIEEMKADVTGYFKKYKKIIFIVYDNGFINDEDKFKKDFENNNTRVLLIKH